MLSFFVRHCIKGRWLNLRKKVISLVIWKLLFRESADLTVWFNLPLISQELLCYLDSKPKLGLTIIDCTQKNISSFFAITLGQMKL